ncbi:MAG: hypothetical protein OEN21_08440 [Myxococcales bacterium]|nr:hypothetical protein [Myxococcales bacterium]
MRRAIRVLFVFLCASLAQASTVAAHDPAIEAKATPTQAPQRISYDEYRRDELEFLAKRSRIALFSTSAAAAVGVALVTPALVNECVRIASSSSFDDVRCSATGRTLLGVGVPFLVAGVVGIIISGTMFGVRKGRIRRLEDRIAYEKASVIRWDPARTAFVF